MPLTHEEVAVSGPSTVLVLDGAVDPTTTQALDAALTALRERGVRHLALDMAGVRYVNSTGLGVLVKHAQALEEAGGAMSLLGITAKVRIVVEMIGLEHVFACVCGQRPQALLAA